MSFFSDGARLNGTLPAEIGCTGKVTFDSYSQAAAVLGRNQTKARPGRSAYRCGHCNQWHIGTDTGRVAQKRNSNFKDRKNHE